VLIGDTDNLGLSLRDTFIKAVNQSTRDICLTHLDVDFEDLHLNEVCVLSFTLSLGSLPRPPLSFAISHYIAATSRALICFWLPRIWICATSCSKGSSVRLPRSTHTHTQRSAIKMVAPYITVPREEDTIYMQSFTLNFGETEIYLSD
jgi:hypothetical protein